MAESCGSRFSVGLGALQQLTRSISSKSSSSNSKVPELSLLLLLLLVLLSELLLASLLLLSLELPNVAWYCGHGKYAYRVFVLIPFLTGGSRYTWESATHQVYEGVVRRCVR